MDNWRDRQRTAEHFKVTLNGEPLLLGGGESLLTDREKFLQAGLSEQVASSRVFSEEELDHLRSLEVILPEKDNERSPKPVGMFYRRMSGPGVSDDAAIIYLGKTYGRDAMYGVLLADAADTYDKFVETYVEGGYDEKLVRLVTARLAKEGPYVTREEIRRMIYFSAKANDPPLDISSSHRRLIQVESGAKVPTFLNHLEYVEGRKPARIPLGYNRFDSEKFYNGISQRAATLRLGWNTPASHAQ